VDGAAGGAKLVHQPNDPAEVLAVGLSELVGALVVGVFDFLGQLAGELGVHHVAGIELVQGARGGLAESSPVELGGLPVAGEKALL
jgi:hypothetical protein